jgi:hypothetical protein
MTTARLLNAEFRNWRVFVRTAALDGTPLTFWTDSGGGAIISPTAVARLGLSVVSRKVEGGHDIPAVEAPALAPDFPGIHDMLMVVDMPPYADGADGLLGQAWHADRVFTYDYPRGHLYLGPALTACPDLKSPHTVPLGFQLTADGQRASAFPRIEAVVDGEAWSFLFDTGATLQLSEKAAGLLRDELAPLGGTCFVTESIMAGWSRRHPDWLRITHGDALFGGTLLRVPEVLIAGYRAGPVWFTSRPDANFREFMSQWMDREIHGALGGSLFRYFQIQVDYPKGIATFHRTQGIEN